VADQFARIADVYFRDRRTSRSIPAWSGVIAFSIQIYFDFSGYTDYGDRAGAAIRLPFSDNFRAHLAGSITDFCAVAPSAIHLAARFTCTYRSAEPGGRLQTIAT